MIYSSRYAYGYDWAEMFNNNKLTKKQNGFTLIELLIATSVFSIVLLIVTTGIIKIGQAYYKGIVQAKTQEVTRNVGGDISRTIQLSNSSVITNPTDPDNGNVLTNVICVGETRYTYKINTPAPQNEALISERIGPNQGCGDMTAGSDRRELLGDNMRLLKFKVAQVSVTDNQTWRIEIRTAYTAEGSEDLLSSYNDDLTMNGQPLEDANCKSGVAGNSFCATAKLDTIVKKRLN